MPNNLSALINAAKILPKRVGVTVSCGVLVIRHGALLPENEAARPIDDDVLQIWGEGHVLVTLRQLLQLGDVLDYDRYGLSRFGIELYPLLRRADCVGSRAFIAFVQRELVHEFLVVGKNLSVVFTA